MELSFIFPIFAARKIIGIMETKKPTKFILALRKYRIHKQEWIEKMQDKLATEEEELRRKREYLYYDMETV
ncbi:MAG: hypothetical protein J6T05_07185 [Prevotella sp.]|nr:hypothetical protein [Prevotella sp.]